MATITGTNGNDDGVDNPALVGGVEDDTIRGLNGNDLLYGGAGNDNLEGGSGIDELYGGLNDDTLIFTALGDTGLWHGGAGEDTFEIIPQVSGTQDLQGVIWVEIETYDGFNQSVLVLAGQLEVFDRIDNIGTIFQQTAGRMNLAGKIASGEAGGYSGTSGNDIFNIAGADTGWIINGLGGDDILRGGGGDDEISGGDGNDLIYGNGGNDLIRGTIGNENLYGGGGDDTFRIESDGGPDGAPVGSDLIDGGTGIDTVLNATFTQLDLSLSTLSEVEILVAGSVRVSDGQIGEFDEIQNLASIQHAGGGTTDMRGQTVSFSGSATEFSFRGSTENDTLLAHTVQGAVNANGEDGDDILHGTGFDDELTTGRGQDMIFGRGGNDLIKGQSGDDALYGGTGDDTFRIESDLNETGIASDMIYGGIGTDTVLNATLNRYDMYLTTFVGVEVLLASSVNIAPGQLDAFDVLDQLTSISHEFGGTTDLRGKTMVTNGTGITFTGSDEDDTIFANEGERLQYFGTSGGNDTVVATPFADFIYGGQGNDHFVGGADGDRLDGNGGNDTLEGGAGDDDLRAGSGNDILHGDAGDDIVNGFEGDDILNGGAGADDLRGRQGTDMASYRGASGGVSVSLDTGTGAFNEAEGDILSDIENLEGAQFDDLLEGDGDANEIYGLNGGDILRGLGGDDLLNGANGDDVLMGGAGGDQLLGGGGSDLATYREASAGVQVVLLNAAVNQGEAAGDTYVSVELVEGSDFGDNLRGSRFSNTVDGRAGDDFIRGNGGADMLNGGNDDDLILGDTGFDTLNGGNGDDRLRGGQGFDTLLGGLGSDLLEGDLGRDRLNGGGGDDHLIGGQGNDILTGLAGADVFDYGVGDDFDRITDFQLALDTLRFAAALFPGTPTGQEIVDDYANAVAEGTLFAFAPGQRVLVEGIADPDNLAPVIDLF